MSKHTPYTYLIGWSQHNKWYYGVKYAKGCHPSQFWRTYFTSSKYVREMRDIHGDPDIIEIRKTFSNSESARMWEHKVLKRMNVVHNDMWINRNDCESINAELNWNRDEYRIKKSKNAIDQWKNPEIKRKMRESIKKSWLCPDRRRKATESYERIRETEGYKNRVEKLAALNVSTYTLTRPNGDIEVIHNLSDWCRRNSFSSKTIRNYVRSGRKINPRAKNMKTFESIIGCTISLSKN